MYMFEFKMPSRIICVNGAAGRLGKVVGDLARSPMIVTDRGIAAAGLIDGVREGIERGAAGVAGVFDGCEPDPGPGVITRCAEAAVACGADCLVSVGGGSCIDTSKAALIRLAEEADLMDFQWKEYEPSRPLLPHVAVPTTAGTGSESTHVAMVTDEGRGRKLIFQGAPLVPRVAVLDPRMVAGLPGALTAATGMDALSHAVEAIHNVWRQPVTDALSLKAVELIAEFLPRTCEDGGDLFARMNMLIAADIAGASASNAFIAIVHAAGHTIGGLHKVAHGTAVGIMLPFAMEMNLDLDAGAVAGPYRKVAGALGMKIEGVDESAGARMAVEGVRDLMGRLGVPARLREAGISEGDLGELARITMEDPAMMVTPCGPSEGDVLDMFKAAY